MKSLKIEICIGTSCLMLGAQDLLDVVEELPPEKRQRVELREVACFKCCGKGPNVRINGDLYCGMTPDQLAAKIEII